MGAAGAPTGGAPLPRLLPGGRRRLPRAAREADAVAAPLVEGDLAYLDPPYNQHSYFANYHVWETLVRWDKPEVYGVASKRTDCRTRQSAFNSRRRHRPGPGRRARRRCGART